MRKLVSTILAVTFVLGLFAGCSQQADQTDATIEGGFYRRIKTDGNYQVIGVSAIADPASYLASKYLISVDDNGRLSRVQHFDGDELVLDRYLGVAEVVFEYGDDFEKRTFLDPNGKPMADRSGVYALMLFKNADGHVVGYGNFDQTGAPMADKAGVAQYDWQIDDLGRRISSVRKGLAGGQIIDEQGIAEVRWKYDSRGNIVESSNHAMEGSLMDGTNGAAVVTNGYDDNGQVTVIGFLGRDRNPTVDVNGICEYRFKFDQFGNVMERSVHDTTGALMYARNGVALMELVFTESGLLIEERNYDTERKLTLGRAGVAITRTEYDDRGNRTSIAYFGSDDTPIEDSQGLSSYCRVFNEEDMPVGEHYFGADGVRKANRAGVAEIKHVYDSLGREIETCTYDLEGNLVADPSRRVACYQREYDDAGRLIEERYLGTDRKLATDNRGYAAVRWQYNERDLRTEAAFLDANLKPVGQLEDSVATVRWEYDDLDQIARVTTYDEDGKVMVSDTARPANPPTGAQ